MNFPARKLARRLRAAGRAVGAVPNGFEQELTAARAVRSKIKRQARVKAKS